MFLDDNITLWQRKSTCPSDRLIYLFWSFHWIFWSQVKYRMSPDLSFKWTRTIKWQMHKPQRSIISALSVPVVAQFDPDNLFVVRFLPCPAITAGPRPLWHLHLQTLRVEGSRAWVAAQQLASYICMDVHMYVCVCVFICVCVHALWEIDMQREEECMIRWCILKPGQTLNLICRQAWEKYKYYKAYK